MIQTLTGLVKATLVIILGTFREMVFNDRKKFITHFKKFSNRVEFSRTIFNMENIHQK